MTTPSPGNDQLQDLQLALALAARDPSPARIAALLRLVSDQEIRSEFSRRLNARRKIRRGGRHTDAVTRRHKHKPTEEARPATEQSPGCRDRACQLSHVTVRCECGALGVMCTKNPRTKWYKPEESK